MNFYALDSETGRLMMIDLAECNDGFQPSGVIHSRNPYVGYRPIPVCNSIFGNQPKHLLASAYLISNEEQFTKISRGLQAIVHI